MSAGRRLRVTFLANGEPASPAGKRAVAFASRLEATLDVRVAYRSRRRTASLVRFLSRLAAERPDVVYVVDMAFSGVLASAIHRTLGRARVVIDTGDDIVAVGRSLGRGAVGSGLTRWLERVSLAAADRLVVRGTFHRDHLRACGREVVVVQDGVDLAQFAPRDETALRRELGLDGSLALGLIGSSVWNDRLQLCSGWELVEAVALLRDLPVRGLLVGSGTGLPRLRRRADELGIADRIRFVGQLPYEDLPRYLGVMDVCLSTQTNDLIGRVRTTGKLPLYLAAGRHVLATRVGEAALVLPERMLVDYEGQRDDGYPARLAARVAPLVGDPAALAASAAEARAVARRHFDYDLLSARVGSLLEETAARGRR